MPPDGSSESRPHLKAEFRAARRYRFRRFMLAAHAVTAFFHVVPVIALSAFLPVRAALVAGVCAFVATGLRLASAAREGRRSRFVTLLVDEPILAHWCAAGLSTIFF